ncbi:hypothetical protein [Acidovorax sp. MR-S7]|uniref:hypothetical protein n=1 Tax=Acidovorax sp. MR-S7 TaxID=1268622 RepID=UPI0003D3F950|nr:hypothetical protein [Acidovorax sp. MR-S7]GAD20946.1 hypothetical protein AVS7_00707 [Acidovorax sp. MR-S7]
MPVVLAVEAPDRLVAESLLSAIQRQARLTDSVICFYSGGKDSAVTLDLCARHFQAVHVVFMYQVPGLSFQEEILAWAESRYGVEIYRIPHFELSDFYRVGVYCKPDPSLPKVVVSDIYAHVRQAFDCHWIAAGERAKDSIVRNAMIKRSGSIDQKRGRFYPLAYWSKEAVLRYIAAHRLRVSPESKVLGHSFRSLAGKDIAAIKRHYPQDYDKIAQAFPEIGAALAREAMYGEDEVPKRHG